MIDPTKRPRVSDAGLDSLCQVAEKTIGPAPGEEHTHLDILNLCALDLRDLRAAHAAWQDEAEKLAAAARAMLLAHEASVRLCGSENVPTKETCLQIAASVAKEMDSNQVMWRAIESFERIPPTPCEPR